MVDEMSDNQSMDSDRNDRSRARKLSEILTPSSPSPMLGKRPQASQSLDGPLSLMKKPKLDTEITSKLEKEVTLHTLLPNATCLKFKTDAARIRSVKAVLDLVQRKAKDLQLKSPEAVTPRPVEWGPQVRLEMSTGEELKNESLIALTTAAKSRSTIILIVQDGHDDTVHSDPDMWNVTPKPEMLGQRPQGYTLETALADQVDNALQAVWHNKEADTRLVSVHLTEDKITIFDNGQGMDSSLENCIANWGTVGGSTHRDVHYKALGGKPPFLKPYLGKYGAGAVAAAFHLGGCVTVWSKTRKSQKVVSLVLGHKELVQRSQKDQQERVWRTAGGFRDMTKKEGEMSPHGSFTGVEITKLKQQYSIAEDTIHAWEVGNVRQLLKDIYFPYIQTEDGSKIIFPVNFELNGTNLRDVTECHTAVANLHACHHEHRFEVEIRLTKAADGNERRASTQAALIEGANARIICQYYPNLKGKESLETVLEELHVLKPRTRSMTFETMNRISVRWLGRLLPEVTWPIFPFMEAPAKKEQRSGARVWAKRVLAFVDTDAGFHPVQSKTDLDRDQPFVVALRHTGESIDKSSASGVKVSIKCEGKEIKASELADLYLKWLKNVHTLFDEEFVFPDTDNVQFIFNRDNHLKNLGVGPSNLLMFHTHMRDSKNDWNIDDNPIYFKLCKGPGLKADKYVTLEYFFHDATDDDRGFQVKFLCRGIEVDVSEGCQITCSNDKDKALIFELKGSEWFPATLLSTAKRLDPSAWKKKMEEIMNKSPGFIEVLNYEDAKHFMPCEVFPVDGSRFEAGFSLPKDFPVVIRPRKGSGASFKQGMIVPEPMEIKLTVTHSPTNYNDSSEVCELKCKGTLCNNVKGLYVFSTGAAFPQVNHLVSKGRYTFKFEVEGEKYKDVRPAVSLINILPSAVTAKWTLCNHPVHCAVSDHDQTKEHVQPLIIRVDERVKEDFFLQKYDEYGNIQNFDTPLRLDLVGITIQGDNLNMHTKIQSSIVAGTDQERERLLLQGIIFSNASLEQLGSTHEALLRVCLAEERLVDIKCKVLPGTVTNVEVASSEPLLDFMSFKESLQPGEVIRNLTLQGLDSCMNRVEKGQKLRVSLEGLEFQDTCGEDRIVDENGQLQLGGLLKVTCNYNSAGSIAIHSGTRLINSITFKTVTRRLVLSHEVPVEAYVGRALQEISVKMVDDRGNIDKSVSVNHSLTVDWQHGLTSFINGECVLPSVQMPEKPGTWKGIISFAADSSIYVTLMVRLKLGSASSIGPTTNEAQILTAVCGMPIIFPFKIYDDHQKPALLSDELRQMIHVSLEPKEEDNDNHSAFRSVSVDHQEVKMSLVDGLPTFEAHIVVSGSAGMYMMTLTDKSLRLAGKAQLGCKLQHGCIAQLVLARSDGLVFQDHEDSDKGQLAIIEVKKSSHLMPELSVKLLDSAHNVCSSCDRTLKVTSLDLPHWKVPVIKITQGIGKLQGPDLEAPVGTYHVVIELERSGEELYSLEEPTRPVTAQFSLRVSPGNYPSKLRLLDLMPVSISLTDEKLQYVPPLRVLVESADGLKLEERPQVGVKLFGDCFLKSGPKEYLGDLVERCKMERDSQTDFPPPQATYEFTQICAPCQAGIYRMDFFVLGCDVESQSRRLIVSHGPPTKILITERVAGLPINDLKVKIVDAYGNLCENLCGLRLDLELTFRQHLTEGPTEGPSQSHYTSFCNSPATVKQGNGDFGVFQLTKCIPGYYSMKVFLVRDETELDLHSLTPAEGEVCVIRGNINQTDLQLCDQNREYEVIHGCEERIARFTREIQLKEAAVREFEKKKNGLEADWRSKVNQRETSMAEQHAFNDFAIIQAERMQPVRNMEVVMKDLHSWAKKNNHNAYLAFFDAFSAGMTFSQYPEEFLGLVVTLAQVEDDTLNRRLAEFLGPSTLQLIVCRTQRAADGLEIYDESGQINENSGLHSFARSRNYEISGNFNVLVLTDVTPYRRVNTRHSQRILDIDPPVLPSGQVPEGFLGYAVNLLYLRPEQIRMRVQTRSQGDAGLRESLFFQLFKFLQVYDFRRNMNYAKEHVGRFEGGAISLDGGFIRTNFQQQFGRRRNNVPISFSLVPFEERAQEASLMPPASNSFERMRKLAAIERDSTGIAKELEALVPTTNETISQLNKLMKSQSNDAKKLRDAQETSKKIRLQISQLQRKNAEAAKNGHITGKDRANSQGSTTMQAIWM